MLPLARLITDSLRLDATPVTIRARLAEAQSLDWSRLAHHADAHTLTPLLYTVWRDADVLDYLPADLQHRFATAYTDNAARNANIRQELLEVHQLLTQADVSHLILKGWPLVERLYADPAHRYMSDHDFLVPSASAASGHRALLEAGFKPLPAKDEWIEKHLPSVWRNDNYRWSGYLYDPLYPRPVELHLRLWEQGWRGLNVRDLPDPWADARSLTVAGTPMRVLSDANTVIHLAMHFAGHWIEREARLNQLLDLARFVARGEHLDWEQVTARAAASRVGHFVFASLTLAHLIFSSPLPPATEWQTLAAQTPHRFQHWLTQFAVEDLLTMDYRQRHKGKDYQLTFLAAQSWRERLGILRFATLPPAAQLLAKYQTRQRWLTPVLYARYLADRLLAYSSGLRK